MVNGKRTRGHRMSGGIIVNVRALTEEFDDVQQEDENEED